MKITDDAHLDHNLSPAHLAWLLARFADRATFFIETVELPEALGDLESAIYGPAAGDAPVPEADVTYTPRGDRAYVSRLIDAPTRPSRLITVIAGPHKGDACILYTAFGGPASPKEPGDETLDDAGRAESEAFWAEHALAPPSGRA